MSYKSHLKNNDIANIDKFEKFYNDLFVKYTHGEKSTHDLISKNVQELLPYSPIYRCPLFSFFKCKYWVDQPYYPTPT